MRPPASRAERCPDPDASHEHGLRHRAFPGLAWHRIGGAAPPPAIEALASEAPGCSAEEIDRRLRAAIGFLQDVDLEIGRVLSQVQRRGLYRELGFGSFQRYVTERLDLAPRTARRLVALARTDLRAPALATAFREGRVHALQAATVLPVAQGRPGADLAWVERARAVSLRRLEDDVATAATGGSECGHGSAAPAAIAFHAPPEVAALFLAMLARAGSLEALLAHATPRCARSTTTAACTRERCASAGAPRTRSPSSSAASAGGRGTCASRERVRERRQLRLRSPAHVSAHAPGSPGPRPPGRRSRPCQ
jgi:hypothetical protein